MEMDETDEESRMEEEEVQVTAIIGMLGERPKRVSLSVIPSMLGPGWTPDRLAAELAFGRKGLIIPVYDHRAIALMDAHPESLYEEPLFTMVVVEENKHPHKWRDILVATAIAATLAYLLVNYISSY